MNKNKKLILMALGSALLLCACKKNMSSVQMPREEKMALQLSASADGTAFGTKSASQMNNEDLLANVVFMVYNADGTLDAISSESNSSTTTLTVTKGAGKTIVAIANPSEAITSQFPTVDLMDDIKTNSLTEVFSTPKKGHVMVGRLEDYDLSGTITGAVEIPVKRLISKISIEKVTNNLDEGLGNVVIKDIFLANAPMSAYYFKDECTFEWAHLGGQNLTDEAMLRTAMNVSIAHNESSTDVANYFYCYPNFCTEDNPCSEQESDSRYTRLVVKAQIKGNDYYYPVSVNSFIEGNKMENNMHYKIKELKIKHVGGLNPDTPIKLEAIGMEVTVTPWNSVELNPEI